MHEEDTLSVIVFFILIILICAAFVFTFIYHRQIEKTAFVQFDKTAL